jgi:hypothetical protein
MGRKTVSIDRPSAIPVEMIATTAYYKAEEHGFTPGHELADWLAAEREVTVMLQKASRTVQKKAAPKKTVSRKKASKRDGNPD